MTTPYHAKYWSAALTLQAGPDSANGLTRAIGNARVDLNPHQVDAALFALRSPFAQGVLLADEVGLGKTIEAALIVAQRWAEGRRRVLVVVPASLRKQWQQELIEKFFLPAVVLDGASFRNLAPGESPLETAAVVVVSYQLVAARQTEIARVAWDLVILDEAHRLRNIYQTGAKTARAVAAAIDGRSRILLTATPLQNSLLELYGLVSIIDEYTFGDLKSFRSQFSRMNTPNDYQALRERIRPICQRTLRRQVLSYVSYTNRHALIQEFVPNDDEQKLYALVSEYLQSPRLYALPASQRQLMTLILRKLLASSTFAISGTLLGLAQKLEAVEEAQASVDAAANDLVDDFEGVDEIEDEWLEDEPDDTAPQRPANQQLTPEQREELQQERMKLHEFHDLARSIRQNSKGDVLLTALRKGFEAANKARASQENGVLQQKAIIFTESRRTQEYLYRLLESSDFAGKVVLFNGTNDDPKSGEIYRQWLFRNANTDRASGSPTADKRAAIVDYFRDEASIMIATEAAAEGINLQFCNLVVNYDLPWNPQRIAPPKRHRTAVLGMCLQIDQFFRQLNEILGLFGDQVFDHRYFFVKFLF